MILHGYSHSGCSVTVLIIPDPQIFPMLEQHNHLPVSHLLLHSCLQLSRLAFLSPPSTSWSGYSFYTSLLPEVSGVLQLWPDQNSMNEVIASFRLPLHIERLCSNFFITTSCPWLSLSLGSAHTETFQLISRRQGGGKAANGNISLLLLFFFSISGTLRSKVSVR